MKPGLAVLALLCLLTLATPARAGEVQVAVAANFVGPLARISRAFTASSGHTLKVSSGSTGKFHAQIVNGAPFDVLLAGDDETPRKLIASGHALAGSQFTYAVGRLVVWSAQPGLVDAQGAVLASGQIRHVAIANPKTAPYGAAAVQYLQARGLTDTLKRKLVTGESIAQTFQFVATGNAELGLVALSQVQVPGRPVVGSYWLVPQNLHDEIRQDAVLLNPGRGNAAAQALLDFLKTDTARRVMRDHGYGP
jgi:molybdate transport system substrate-binding protein